MADVYCIGDNYVFLTYQEYYDWCIKNKVAPRKDKLLKGKELEAWLKSRSYHE